MTSHYLRTICAFLILPVVWLVEARASDIPADLTKAVIEENWQGVADLCADEQLLATSPALRILKGHACLALNRNDESMSLFLSAGSPADIAAWNDWTTSLAAKNPNNPIVLYLRGDALARAGDWKGAITQYSLAIQAKKDHALALNARGIAYTYTKDFGQSKEDFKAACQAQPDLADAHANYGTMLVVKEAAEGALAEFEIAVAKSKAFALAYNGRGCARLGHLRDEKTLTAALGDFALASSCEPTHTLAEANIEGLRRFCVGETQDDTATKGTTVTARDVFETLKSSGPDAANRLMNTLPQGQQDTIRSQARGHEIFANAVAIPTGIKGSISSNVGVNVGPIGANIGGGHAIDPTVLHNDSAADGKLWGGVSVSGTMAGGGDTQGVAMAQSIGDMGPWPAKKTCFGLFPNTPLPDKP